MFVVERALEVNCDVRWVTSQAMLADCLTKTMDSSVLRECLRTGKYSLFDEDQVLKQRADGRQRLKWIREHQNGTTETSEVLNDAEQEQACLYVQKTEPKDFWCLGKASAANPCGSKNSIFVPIGVTDCPVSIKCLSACRETRVKGGRVERDFTRGAARFPSPWTGETIFYQKLD